MCTFPTPWSGSNIPQPHHPNCMWIPFSNGTGCTHHIPELPCMHVWLTTFNPYLLRLGYSLDESSLQSLRLWFPVLGVSLEMRYPPCSNSSPSEKPLVWKPCPSFCSSFITLKVTLLHPARSFCSLPQLLPWIQKWIPDLLWSIQWFSDWILH